jgi:CBS domain-containing protein
MAVAMRDCSPTGVSAEAVITGTVHSVAPEDDVQKALQVMQEHKVRRLPVVSSNGELQGMLSMNDIVLAAEKETGKKPLAIPYADVVNTYKAICAHPVPTEQVQGAVAGT